MNFLAVKLFYRHAKIRVFLKSYLTNHALTAPITNGRLDFGTWQQIFYAEFDGQREKRILVKVTGLRA